MRLLLPGGNQVFKMKNVTFSGEGQAHGEAVIMAPQDCGLLKIQHNDGMAALCNVDFFFEDVDFSKVRLENNGSWVGYNAVVGSPTAPVYISHDGSLADNRFLISSLYDGFEKIDGCYRSPSDDHRFKGAVACDKEEVKIARLVIWTSSSQGSTGIFHQYQSSLFETVPRSLISAWAKLNSAALVMIRNQVMKII